MPHTLPGGMGDFRRGSGESGVSTWKLAEYAFFAGSGDLPGTWVHLQV